MSWEQSVGMDGAGLGGDVQPGTWGVVCSQGPRGWCAAEGLADRVGRPEVGGCGQPRVECTEHALGFIRQLGLEWTAH
jgi:hypothetical protein